ncbi:hypothetical protein DV737_g2536, partial [Chaetothyriales sp. CBS 132003]
MSAPRCGNSLALVDLALSSLLLAPAAGLFTSFEPPPAALARAPDLRRGHEVLFCIRHGLLDSSAMSTPGVVPATAAVNSAAASTQGSPPPAADAYLPPSTAEDEVRSSATPVPPAAEDDAQSQPMTASASNSSLTVGADHVDDIQNVYGTRSRNRTGGTRPNYADDKELDLEIEAAGRISKPTTLSGFAAVNGSALTGGDATPQSAARPSTPASLPVPSKKRKHPGGQTTSASAPAHSSHTLDSRSRYSSSAASSYVQTNMMTFRRVESRLNAKKQLVADDGTVLAAN